MLSTFKSSAVKLGAIMPSVNTLSFIMLSVVMLSVIMPNVEAPIDLFANIESESRSKYIRKRISSFINIFTPVTYSCSINY